MDPDPVEQSGTEGASKPDWWEKNETYRERFELPEYEPPRFYDGVYTHEVVVPLEEKYGCTIQFRGENTEYPDDIDVRVNGETVFSVGRYRTPNGNTRYEITSEEFRERVGTYRTESSN